MANEDNEIVGAEVKPDLAIGVGCIWFATDDPGLSSGQYFQLLSEQLGKIDSVTNVELTGDSGKYGDLIPLYVEDEELFFSHIYWTKLKFRIFIPYKIQERLDARCKTEHFSVYINGHYELPVTYVAGTWDDFNGGPSTAIVLVRKYLAEKFASGSMHCGCIGPSPFHADFFTLSGPETTLNDLSEGAGYKQYLFASTGSETAGLDEFVGRYGDTFSLFYHLQNLRSKALSSEIDVANATRELLYNAKAVGWFARIKASFRSGELIDRVNEAALEEQLFRSLIRSELSRAEDDEPKDQFNELKYHFGELRRYGAEQPISNIQNVVSTFEKRRQGLLQNVTVVVAGLAGGIIGAILGSSLTFALATPNQPTPTPISRSVGGAQPAPPKIAPESKPRPLQVSPSSQSPSN